MGNVVLSVVLCLLAVTLGGIRRPDPVSGETAAATTPGTVLADPGPARNGAPDPRRGGARGGSAGPPGSRPCTFVTTPRQASCRPKTSWPRPAALNRRDSHAAIR